MLKYLLLPFSLIYGAVLYVRHFLYDYGILSSRTFDFPLIVIGNLSVGGTGKSPMTMYLANLLEQYHPAVLSRGYGRKTRGFVEVNDHSNHSETGDEPMMFKYLIPNLEVFVCEDRPAGVERILSVCKNCRVILLDDAFQHRKLNAGLTILLFDYEKLVQGDFLLPAGRRRDLWVRRHKADFIVVTRSPALPDQNLLRHFPKKKVFFSRYRYVKYQNIEGNFLDVKDLKGSKIYLLTGIASPEGLVRHYKEISSELRHDCFPDHHDYTENDVNRIRKNMVMFAGKDGKCITTTKDLMRLKELLEPEMLRQFYFAEPLVEIDQAQEFNHMILTYVNTGIRNNSLY